MYRMAHKYRRFAPLWSQYALFWSYSHSQKGLAICFLQFSFAYTLSPSSATFSTEFTHDMTPRGGFPWGSLANVLWNWKYGVMDTGARTRAMFEQCLLWSWQFGGHIEASDCRTIVESTIVGHCPGSSVYMHSVWKVLSCGMDQAFFMLLLMSRLGALSRSFPVACYIH